MRSAAFPGNCPNRKCQKKIWKKKKIFFFLGCLILQHMLYFHSTCISLWKIGFSFFQRFFFLEIWEAQGGFHPNTYTSWRVGRRDMTKWMLHWPIKHIKTVLECFLLDKRAHKKSATTRGTIVNMFFEIALGTTTWNPNWTTFRPSLATQVRPLGCTV